MRIVLLAAAAVTVALTAAPVAAAAPQCTNTGPNTTQCTTGGSTQIVTSPPAMNYGPFYGGWGGGITIGGWNIGI